MKKILITGAGGYIGSVSTHLFLQRGYKVIALDSFCRGFREPLRVMQKKFGKQNLKIYKVDLVTGDLNRMFSKEKDINTVVHYAAFCLVDESMREPYKYFRNNVCGTNNLLSAMVGNGIFNIVFSSTCAVYGEAEYMPVDEGHSTKPSNPYGESKLMVENIIRWHASLKKLNYVILRYFNVCGATDGGLIGDSKKPSVLLMQNAVRGALGIEPFYLTCPEVDTPDKTPIRDYINVVDLNDAHERAVRYLQRKGKSEIINLGTGSGNSVLEIVEMVQKETGCKFNLKKGKKRRGEYAKMIASVKKARKILNWVPERTIKESVKSLIKWYTKHPRGWDS